MSQVSAQSGDPRPVSNIYTVLSFIAFLTVLGGVIFMMYVNTAMFDQPWYNAEYWFHIDQTPKDPDT